MLTLWALCELRQVSGIIRMLRLKLDGHSVNEAAVLMELTF